MTTAIVFWLSLKMDANERPVSLYFGTVISDILMWLRSVKWSGSFTNNKLDHPNH